MIQYVAVELGVKIGFLTVLETAVELYYIL